MAQSNDAQLRLQHDAEQNGALQRAVVVSRASEEPQPLAQGRTNRLWRAALRGFGVSTDDTACPTARQQQAVQRHTFLRAMAVCSVLNVLGGVLNAAAGFLIADLSPEPINTPQHVISLVPQMSCVFFVVSVYMLGVGGGNLILLRTYLPLYRDRLRIRVLFACQALYMFAASVYMLRLLVVYTMVDWCSCYSTERLVRATGTLFSLVPGVGQHDCDTSWILVFATIEPQTATFAGDYAAVHICACGGAMPAAEYRLAAAAAISSWANLLLAGLIVAFGELLAVFTVQTMQLHEFARNDTEDGADHGADAVSI